MADKVSSWLLQTVSNLGPPSWTASGLHAFAARPRATKAPGAQPEPRLRPITRRCIELKMGSHLASNVPPMRLRGQLEEEHQPVTRRQYVLQQRQHALQQPQGYKQQKEHSKPVGPERQDKPKGHPLVPQQILHLSPIRYAVKRKASDGGAAGPKKPGNSAAAGKVAGAGHVFNIYKDIGEDHELLPYEAYPSWLLALGQPEKSYGELAFTFLYGMVRYAGPLPVIANYVKQSQPRFYVLPAAATGALRSAVSKLIVLQSSMADDLCAQGIEHATLQEYMRFCRLHTKNIIKLNNMRLKKAQRSSVKPIYYDI